MAAKVEPANAFFTELIARTPHHTIADDDDDWRAGVPRMTPQLMPDLTRARFVDERVALDFERDFSPIELHNEVRAVIACFRLASDHAEPCQGLHQRFPGFFHHANSVAAVRCSVNTEHRTSTGLPGRGSRARPYRRRRE